MDRGNRYGAAGNRGVGYSPTRKNDGNRRPNSFQRSSNDSKDDRSEYLERYLGKFTALMNKGVDGDSSSRARDSREDKFVPKNEKRSEGNYNRGSRGGGEGGLWKGQASGHIGGKNQLQRPQHEKRTPFDYSSSKPTSNIPRQNQQQDFRTPTMVPPPSGKMPGSQLSTFNKTFPVWQSESERATERNIFDTNRQGSRFMSADKSQTISSSNPMPVPAPSLSLLSGGAPPDRGYSNLQPHIPSFLHLQAGSSQLGLTQIPDSNAARSFNASVPPPSVALPAMASLGLPSELGKSTPDGSGMWTYPAPELNSLTFDPATGLRFDAITGLHYDANSGYFYNYKLGLYLVYDVLKQTYVRAPVHAGLGEQSIPTMMQPGGAPVPQPLLTQTPVPVAAPIAIQEPPRQSIMAALQWNPQITPSPNNLALNAQNALKSHIQEQYENMADDSSDNDMDTEKQNRNIGYSMSRAPRHDVMNQRQDKKGFGELGNRNKQNFGRKAHEMKRSRSRSISPQERQLMHKRSDRIYQQPQARNFSSDQNLERNSKYGARPNVMGQSGREFSEDRSSRRSPADRRRLPDERGEDFHLSSDPKSRPGYNPHIMDSGPFVSKDSMKNRRSPVNRHKVDGRTTLNQNFDQHRQSDGQRANSSRHANLSQERSIPEHRRPANRSPSLEMAQGGGSRGPTRYEDDTSGYKMQDRRNTVNERAAERRSAPSIENQSSTISGTHHAAPHSSGGRTNSPGIGNWRKGRRNEGSFENPRSSWSSRQERQHSPFADRVHPTRTRSRERDSTRRSPPSYDSKAEVSKIRDIEDYSEDVTALLLDQSSETSMEMGDGSSSNQREKASSRSKSEQRTRSRDLVRMERTDRDGHGEKQLSKPSGRRSRSPKRSFEGREELRPRRSRSREATDTRRRAPKSPISPTTRRDGSRPRPEHRESETRPRSPPSRADPQRGHLDSRKIGNSRRPGRDLKSPVRGRDARQRSPPRRVSRSPLSRLGEVRQNVDRTGFERKQVRRRSPSNDRSDRRLDDRERRNSPARSVNRRNSPQSRQSPHDDRSNRRDGSAKVRSTDRHRSSSDLHSEISKSPNLSPTDSRNRREYSPSCPQKRPRSPDIDLHRSPAGLPGFIPEDDSSRFDRNNSQSRVQSVKDFCSRIDKMSPDQNEFTNRRPTDPDSKNGNGSRKESDDRDPCESETLNRSRESFENNSQKGRQNQSRTPQKHESKRSVSPQAKKLKLENISGPSESNRKSDVIVLDSDDELGIVNPIVDEAPMTDDDAANDDDDQRLKPSQSVGNLSMNSDELNYSASSVGSEPFNEEDESWTVLDCVEGESDKGSEHATSEKEDGYNREMELPSSSRIDEYKPRRRRTRPSRRVRSRKPAQPIDGHSPADEEEFLGLCKPVDGDGHSLSQFFEPNPTKFIAATYRMRNLPFRFVKNVLVEACEELGEDVKVIPCKRDFNAAPYDYVTMIFPDASLAAEWHSRHNGKIVTEFRHQTLEIFLYFHLGNWTCENCEAINFPLRTICYSCFLHKDGGYSPVQMLNSPSRFIAIYKLGNIRANGAVKPFIGLFKRNPYKRLHLIRDPRTNHFSGICVIEMPNRVKGQSLFQRLPAEYKNESRCAYVKMMQPDEDYEIGDVRLPTRKKHASSKMPFQHFRDLQKRAQLPKHRVPKPDGRGLLVYPPPDKEQFTFEPITKMYYDPITGLYFHPHSNLFYNDELHICLRWDADRSSYLYIDTADVE